VGVHNLKRVLTIETQLFCEKEEHGNISLFVDGTFILRQENLDFKTRLLTMRDGVPNIRHGKCIIISVFVLDILTIAYTHILIHAIV